MSSQYPLTLSLQLFMIFLDLIFNAVCTIISNNNTTLLMVYMQVRFLAKKPGFRLQDTLIVIAIIVLAITFSSTFVFQAGLISILLKKFSSSIIFSVLYLLVSVFYHYLSLNRHWSGEKSEIWPPLIYGLYVVHRLLAILYYTSYKRAALLLSDPKYHGISEWLKLKIRQVGR